MASLQAKHSRHCGLERLDAIQRSTDGLHLPAGPRLLRRGPRGRKAYKERVGRNRRDAERALRKIAVSVDEGAYRPQENIGFSVGPTAGLPRSSASRAPSLLSLDDQPSEGGRSGTSASAVSARRTSRASTRSCARALDSTRAKHLRVLGACLQAALRHRYAAATRCASSTRRMKPRPERKEAAYFENDELPRLFAELDAGRIRTSVSSPSRRECDKANSRAPLG